LKRAFVDSGVLIAAAIGTAEISLPSREILDDPDREFVSSDFVRLEVSPKAIYHHRDPEAQFYAVFFESVAIWVPVAQPLIDLAYAQACQYGLSALDALHVAAAEISNCDEMITTEKPGRPIHRVAGLRVVSIYPTAASSV
jgi:predicted nucleic acid-binding protein